MKAQIIESFGNPGVFKLTEIPKPSLLPGHVIIRVMATSVNPIDSKIRSGAVTGIAPHFPAILHGDVAGIITEVAADVTNFKIGDEVYGCAGGVQGSGGALAELMLVDAKLIAKKPKLLSMTEAAALPLVSITAWLALFEKAQLDSTKEILIHGGVGGVGHIAVQLAEWCGAKVYTTVMRQEDFPVVKALGASENINAKEETVTSYVQRLTRGKGFDLIFDTVGGTNLDRCFDAAADNGIIVTTAARGTHDLTALHNKGLSLHGISMLIPLVTNVGRERYGKILTKIASIVDKGRLKSLIASRAFTLETISEAHAFLESGNAQGKIVLTVN